MRDFGMTVMGWPPKGPSKNKVRIWTASKWLCGGLIWFALAAAPVCAEPDELESSIEFAPDDPVDAPTSPVAPPMERPDPVTSDSNDPPLLQSHRKYETNDNNSIVPKKPTLSLRGQNREATVFGAYRVRLSYAIPKFNGGLKSYKTAYGNANGYPEIGADWFAWDWYASLGVGLRAGYYTANGHALQVNDGVNKTDPKTLGDGDVHIDPNGPTALTLLPLKLLATAELTPFRRKWVVVDGWAGYERLYFQEVRKVPVAATNTGTTAAAPVDMALVNRGWLNATVVGAAVNVLLNPIDQASSYSAHTGMGIGSIYLTGYSEWIRALDRNRLSFGRTVFGIAFTFETSN